MTIEYDEDDLPTMINPWERVVEALKRTREWFENYQAEYRKLPTSKARYKTEKWKEQHRKAAREHMRRKRAELKRQRSKKPGKP